MSYRCNVCEAKVPPRQPRLVYLVMRTLNLPKPRQEIAAEVPVCSECYFQLDVLELTLEECRRGRKSIALPAAPKLQEIITVEETQPKPLLASKIIKKWQRK